ncbi:MAG: glycine zipper family protein [Pseudoxanthomonas sp.]
MRRFASLFALLGVLALPGVALAQKPSVYPAKGQSAAQKIADDGQCLAWARQDTGIDPAAAASATPAPSGPQGERARGALRGAAAGAVVGEVVDDDAGDGAAAGATLGVLAGGRRARQNQAAQKHAAQASQAQALDRYYGAYGACMEGRGYTVN